MDWLTTLFSDTSSIAHIIVLYSVVIALGMWIGKFKVAGISLDATFVLFVGIIAGHIYFSLGIHDADGGGAAPASVLNFIQEFGLMLFVYCIGLQVGPGFFHSFKKGGGLQMNYIAIGIVLLSVITMMVLYYCVMAPRGRATDLPMMVGVLYGAVTNTPGLGAAQEALRSIPGMDNLDIASGYACAYPLGVFGIIGATILIRYLCRIKLHQEEENYRHQQEDNPHAKPHRMTLRVNNHALYGKTLRQVSDFLGRTFVCTRLKHEGEIIIPNRETIISEGDLMNVVCATDDAEAVTAFIGDVEEDYDWKVEKAPIVSKRILVTQPEMNGKTFGEMHFSTVFGVNVTRITRHGMELFADRNLRIQIGDRLLVVGEADAVERVANRLGNQLKRLDRPNIGVLFLGALIGIIFGCIPLRFPGMSIPMRLGLAGGPLIIAILIGAYDYRLHVTSYMTSSANLMLRQLGLTLFLASVGIKAGAGFWQTVTQGDGLTYVWMGFIITIVPLLIMGIIARKVYKFNYFSIMGIIAGATTDPPALGYAAQLAPNDAPNVAYSTVYPLSMFLRILIAQSLIMFLCG
ncbi:MAG: putative transporter [Paludibacteraceae bacterium]|nr:putative transporter [Paludibacteraceae bacterium]